MSDEAARVNALDTRVGALEQVAAVLRQRSDDHESDIRVFGPLVTDNVRMLERLNVLHKRLDEVVRDAGRLRKDLNAKAREDQEREERHKRFRVSMYLSLAVIVVTVGGFVIALLTLLGGHG